MATLSYPEQFKARYQLLHPVGQGRRSTVWAVKDLVLGQILAIKMVVGEDWQGLVREEFDNNKLLVEALQGVSSCFPHNFDHGFISAEILDEYPEIMNAEARESKEMGVSGYEDLDVA